MRGELDFWVGEWEAEWDGGRGTNVVTAELDGAVILERFDGRPGSELRGISVSVHDGTEWRQTWVDNQQGCIELRGGLEAGEMVLRSGDFRMRFTEIRPASFVWLWERTLGDGWEVRWRIDYRRRGT